MAHKLDPGTKAAQATLDAFRDRPFKFGRYDCGQMVRFHLMAIGLPVKEAAKAGVYHSALGAKRALKKMGYESLPAMADAHFQRIVPAAAVPGDLIQIPSEDDTIGGLTIALGNGRVVGYHEDAPGAAVLQPVAYVAAWRVIPFDAGPAS